MDGMITSAATLLSEDNEPVTVGIRKTSNNHVNLFFMNGVCYNRTADWLLIPKIGKNKAYRVYLCKGGMKSDVNVWANHTATEIWTHQPPRAR